MHFENILFDLHFLTIELSVSAKSPTEELYIASGLHVNQPLSITQIVWYWEIGLGRAASVAVLMQATKNVYLMF